tara:strand:+ start:29 stop:340 length:312 start_codon:yes stop_codon:yes gene_type:complete
MNSRTSNLYIGNINPGATSERLSATTSSAVSLAALYADTDYVVIDVQTNNVLVTFDGTAATSTNGHLLVKDQGLIVLTKNAAAGASFIGSGGTAIVYAEQFVD